MALRVVPCALVQIIAAAVVSRSFGSCYCLKGCLYFSVLIPAPLELCHWQSVWCSAAETYPKVQAPGCGDAEHEQRLATPKKVKRFV